MRKISIMTMMAKFLSKFKLIGNCPEKKRSQINTQLFCLQTIVQQMNPSSSPT